MSRCTMIIDPDAVEYQQAATVTETLAEVYHLLTESSDSEDLGRLISARVESHVDHLSKSQSRMGASTSICQSRAFDIHRCSE